MENQILKIADDAFHGKSDPIEAYVNLKRLEKILGECVKSVQPLAIKESYEKYHEKTFDAFGARIEKKMSAGRWDFSKIKEWNDSKVILQSIEDRAKASYQSNLKGMLMTDENTGEIIQPASFNDGSETISIKIL